ncbi:hypothetical protein O0A24_06355 [Staphylococcus pseudintermedius]|nr:hypothetical protein [Staphylococcus pseudintermedius]EJD5760152.1 hypothetical protein [Staphylococcus pseudintermedius]EJG0205318.1 hypothetical protein [Staphylococcus pseudintermedius]MDK3732287.1 hypothetical protein [Staphylococcus pseudintermedius]MDK3866556.1 hypothetical protein [Staphylococcus pseudintermedius]
MITKVVPVFLSYKILAPVFLSVYLVPFFKVFAIICLVIPLCPALCKACLDIDFTKVFTPCLAKIPKTAEATKGIAGRTLVINYVDILIDYTHIFPHLLSPKDL